MELADYENDPRQKFVLSSAGLRLRQETARMYLYAKDKIVPLKWHWLQFHLTQNPGHPVGIGLVHRCSRIEAKIPKAGAGLIGMIASHAGRPKNRQDYQQILQVFAEILIIDQILHLNWPENTAFFYEPVGRTGKRPELMVTTPDQQFLFEVKSPSLLDHQEKRATNEIQLPQRHLVPLEKIDKIVGDKIVTFPRDTPVKDFLVNSEGKFADFPKVPGANIVVIVWDDHIYEPISSLVGDPAGLLTPGSWHKTPAGDPVSYPNIDGVVLVRHMTYFQRALADDNLMDRNSLFDFGLETDLPNVFVQSPGGREVPNLVKVGLRAVDVKDKALEHMAEYHAQDYVIWINGR